MHLISPSIHLINTVTVIRILHRTYRNMIVWNFFRFIDAVRPKRVLEQELQELWDHLEALNSPVVFCHNDLLPKNIIYNEDKGMSF